MNSNSHSLTHSLTHTQSVAVRYALTHSLTHSLTHDPTFSFVSLSDTYPTVASHAHLPNKVSSVVIVLNRHFIHFARLRKAVNADSLV